jgi:hypothetical protein
MFVVTETDAAAIWAAFDQGGELAAAVDCGAYSQASTTTRAPWRVPELSRAGSRLFYRTPAGNAVQRPPQRIVIADPGLSLTAPMGKRHLLAEPCWTSTTVGSPQR